MIVPSLLHTRHYASDKMAAIRHELSLLLIHSWHEYGARSVIVTLGTKDGGVNSEGRREEWNLIEEMKFEFIIDVLNSLRWVPSKGEEGIPGGQKTWMCSPVWCLWDSVSFSVWLGHQGVAAFKQRNSTLAPKGRMGLSVARSSVMEAS